ncbi:chorismate-binding protein [Streptosporangium sp. NBC_01495]|uniref:anthranilate synthase component I family protein n=1 Tax=Streptosporangium sp. NBC_01495 TaxID=2903899 RepID=UPI002E341780|nr:chorismate-binding protein [Streptosporangium sp. NBC_01495]
MTFSHTRATFDLDTVPGCAEAGALAGDYAVIPVYREFLADALTPITVFDRLCGPDDTGFLLESVPVSGDVGRYSYIGHRPRLLDPPVGDPLAEARGIAATRAAPVPGVPPFHGGVVGYLGYETASRFERLPVPAGPAPGVPESAFMAAEDMVVFDHATRKLLVLTLYRPDRESYGDAVERLDRMGLCLRSAPSAPDLVGRAARSRPRAAPDSEGWHSNVTREEFERRVTRAREYIAAGDAFQIVLSQRFSRPLRVTPLDLYRHLRAVNPSPYMYHLSLGGGRHVVGASPELLVRTDGRTARTRPLAGSRPRGANPHDDLALERDLRGDAKERAEHVMLVDLGRHDIGRVCAPGTVRVERLMEVERFSHVMHLSSTVAGELLPEATCLDALRWAFPAGTLSGAPKIRAMEIIAELETERRGVYGGAIGFVGVGDTADLAIGLRTMVIADDTVYVQAGAGIVAESDPTAEYLETLHKANALFSAVREAEATT